MTCQEFLGLEGDKIATRAEIAAMCRHFFACPACRRTLGKQHANAAALSPNDTLRVTAAIAEAFLDPENQ